MTPQPATPTLLAGAETAEALEAQRSWRRYEEAMWWAVCFVAVAIILWRQLA